MRLAIGMVELNSIARGIETCDYMVKAAQIELLRASFRMSRKVSDPDGGETGDVRASMKEGIIRGGECVVDTLTLPNVHPSLIPAMTGEPTQVPEYGAVGVLEFYSVASAITAADVAAESGKRHADGSTYWLCLGGKVM